MVHHLPSLTSSYQFRSCLYWSRVSIKILQIVAFVNGCYQTILQKLRCRTKSYGTLMMITVIDGSVMPRSLFPSQEQEDARVMNWKGLHPSEFSKNNKIFSISSWSRKCTLIFIKISFFNIVYVTGMKSSGEYNRLRGHPRLHESSNLMTIEEVWESPVFNKS